MPILDNKMLSLGSIFKMLLLVANSMAVLHEERFLKKVGLSEHHMAMETGMKLQVITLLRACRLLRFPILVINVVTILVLLVAG